MATGSSRACTSTANYKFAKSPEGYEAVRQGDLLIYGFGQKPGTRRSVKQQAIYTALQAKFGKVFEPEIKFHGFKFAQGKLAAAGQFLPREIISQNGWLVIGYGRTGSSMRWRGIDRSRRCNLSLCSTRLTLAHARDVFDLAGFGGIVSGKIAEGSPEFGRSEGFHQGMDARIVLQLGGNAQVIILPADGKENETGFLGG